MINKDLNSLRRLKRSLEFRVRAYFFGTSKPVIKFLVIGAQKGGTTALYHYLSQHPDIEIPNTKELDYFTSIGSETPLIDSYLSLFPTRIGRHQKFCSVDISPSYLLDAATAAKNIHRLFPSTKLVVVLREPVERAISSWFMYKKYYQTQPNWYLEANWVKNSTVKKLKTTRRSKHFGNDFFVDIEEEIKVLETGGRIEYPIVEFGHYKTQLEHYVSLFGLENMMILESDELKRSTQVCLNKITDWVDLDKHELRADQLVPHFVGDNKVPLPSDNLDRLTEYYRRQNNGLEELISQKLSWVSAK